MEDSAPVGLRFSLLSRAIKKQIDESIRDEGLTGVQLFVLCQLQCLEEKGGEVNQKDLEAVTRVTHPSMTDMLKRLEKKDYVICQRSAADRRFKCIRSTEKAVGLNRRMDEADRRAFSALCEGLSDAEVRQMLRATGHMADNAAAMLKKGSEACCDQNACQKSAGV